MSKMGSEVDCSGVSRAVWLVKVKQLHFRAFKLTNECDQPFNGRVL